MENMMWYTYGDTNNMEETWNYKRIFVFKYILLFWSGTQNVFES